MDQHWILQHPSPGIADRRRQSTLLIEPPGRFSTTRRWQQFRGELTRLLSAHASDPNLPAYLEAADAVLAWRDTVPAEGRFWTEDRD